jgi:hypothetical protein
MVKRLAVLGLAAMIVAAAAGQASAQTITYGRDTGVFSDPPQVVFINTATPLVPYARGQWHTIDLEALGVPSNAIAANLIAILGITHAYGYNVQCWVGAQFRRPGSTEAAGNWDAMSTKFQSPEGDREATAIPEQAIAGGRVDFYWDLNASPGTEWCASLPSGIFLNIKLTSFLLPAPQ